VNVHLAGAPARFAHGAWTGLGGKRGGYERELDRFCQGADLSIGTHNQHLFAQFLHTARQQFPGDDILELCRLRHDERDALLGQARQALAHIRNGFTGIYIDSVQGCIVLYQCIALSR
jgi:hypothetical protein